MRVLVCGCYGGFELSDEFLEAYPQFSESCYYDEDFRTDSELIQAVEDFGLERASDDDCHLVLVDVPDEATDMVISEYDGLESVYYVLDGRIHEA